MYFQYTALTGDFVPESPCNMGQGHGLQECECGPKSLHRSNPIIPFLRRHKLGFDLVHSDRGPNFVEINPFYDQSSERTPFGSILRSGI